MDNRSLKQSAEQFHRALSEFCLALAYYLRIDKLLDCLTKLLQRWSK